MSANVLLFCPTFEKNGKLQIRNRTRSSIEALEGCSQVEISASNPYSDRALNILAQYKRARALTLAGNHSHLLTFEHDMVAPPDGLKMLLEIDAPVVYGLYVLRHGRNVINAWRKNPASNYPGMSLSLFPDELRAARKKVIVEVSGVGFGFTLIRRDVLEAIDFHAAVGGRSQVPDVPFSADCLQHGFMQICRFDVECGHIDQHGSILWAFRNGGKMTKKDYIALADFNAEIDGIQVSAKAGEVLSCADASELVRAGYLKEKPAKKASAKKEPAKPAAKK